MKRVLKIRSRKKKLPDYMTVSGAIQMARVNGGQYTGDSLTESHWPWPTSTWMRERMRAIRNGGAGQ